MMEVDHQPPKPSEQDSQEPFLSPIALSVTPTSGRAQTRVQHRPSTLKITTPTTKQASARKIHEKTMSKVERKHDTSLKKLYVLNPAPYQEQYPKDPLDAPIPPKPLYSDCPSNKTAIEYNNASSPHVLRHKNNEKPSFSINTLLLPSTINRRSKKHFLDNPKPHYDANGRSNTTRGNFTQCHGRRTMAMMATFA